MEFSSQKTVLRPLSLIFAKSNSHKTDRFDKYSTELIPSGLGILGNQNLMSYFIKQIMSVFILAMVRIFSFGERWNVSCNSAIASLSGTFHLSPHENILTIARIKTFIICIIITGKSFSTSDVLTVIVNV